VRPVNAPGRTVPDKRHDAAEVLVGVYLAKTVVEHLHKLGRVEMTAPLNRRLGIGEELKRRGLFVVPQGKHIGNATPHLDGVIVQRRRKAGLGKRHPKGSDNRKCVT